jgi:predicted amidohydrolase
MNSKLKISIVQSNLVWENIDKNLELFSNKLSKLEKTDLIILPEMFNTGFSMNSKNLAEKEKGKSLNWLINLAKDKNSAVIASLIIEKENNFYNRLYFVFPDGKYQYYNKRHLFRMANENEFYTAGNESIIVNYKGFRIKPLVCYDLRFPVWSRNKNDYDLLLYIANWPERRNEPWKILLKARAIENQVFVVGVNRIGTDGNNVFFSGGSAVINYKGEIISKTKAHKEYIETVEIYLDELNDFKEKFPAYIDADKFEIKE